MTTIKKLSELQAEDLYEYLRLEAAIVTPERKNEIQLYLEAAKDLIEAHINCKVIEHPKGEKAIFALVAKSLVAEMDSNRTTEVKLNGRSVQMLRLYRQNWYSDVEVK